MAKPFPVAIKYFFISWDSNPQPPEKKIHTLTTKLFCFTASNIVCLLIDPHTGNCGRYDECLCEEIRPGEYHFTYNKTADEETSNSTVVMQWSGTIGDPVRSDTYTFHEVYTVRHEELFHILYSLDIDGKDLRILKTLYWKQTATVRVGGECSEETRITRGVRQGCILSPDLFNLYSEMILRELDNIQGIGLGGHNINNIRYADDTV
ncbi:retrovirus-related Pol polyprotein LINE-1 [Elysia marginata]|uniref:Retrovirus-related Pol polyprotein LINE-1 n=1 Tax=Elysia marginata TaxID=1093978 RepID=A0AAV4GEX0_9GAST|nr:retrovirus-related Pol polyprotein LINE-1 [Elysia marginata]